MSYDVNLEALHNVSKLRLYQPLLDGHLSDYFNNASTRRHLQKLGLVRYLIQIDSNGRIVDDAAFKRHQISLDKKAESENAQHLDMQRKMHLEIQNLLRHSSARVNNEKRLKPTSTDPAITALTKLFPERLKNTAAIYIKEMENNSRSNDASSASGEKKTLTRPASAKGREITYGQKNALHNQNSILDIFVKAKEDYEDGKLGSSERNLRYILKLVQHSAKKSPGSKRPKSARPTRDSKYPISEFSDGDSEPGNQEELAKSTSSLNGVLDQPEKSRSQKSLTFSDRVLEISADATISPIAIAEIKKSTLSLAKQDIVAERQGKEDFENLRLVGDVDESGNALHISESTPQPLLKRPETAVGSFPDMSPMFLDEEGSGEAKCRDIVVLNDSALLGQEGNLHNPSAVVPDIKDFIIGFDTEFYGEIPAESVPIINRDAGKLVVVEVPSENLRKESSNGLDHVQVKLRDTNETEDNQFEDAESVAFILSSLGDIYSEKFNNDAAVLQTSDSAANMHNSREKIEQEADKSGDANVQDNLTAAQLQDSITDVKNLQRKDPVAVPLTPQSRKFNPFSGISSMFSKRAKQPMLEANSTESPLPIERKNTKRNLDQTSIPNLIAEKKKAHVGEKELKCELSQPGSSAADTTSQPSEIITAKTEPDIVPAVANQAEYPQLTVVSVGNSQHDSIPLETDIKENEPITIHPVVHLAEEYYEGQEVTSASLAVSPMHEKQEIKNMNNANPQGAKSVIERKLHHRGKEGGVKKPQPAGVHHKSKLPRGVDATPTTQSNRSIQKSDSQDIGKPPAKALGTFSQPTPTRLEPDSLSGSGLSMALKSYFSNSSRKEKALMRQQGLKQARNALGINLHGEVIVASRLADSHNASQSDNIIASTADDVSEKAAEKVVGLSSSEKSNSVRPASKSNLTEKSASARSVKDKSSSAMSSVENVATGNAVDAKTDASASENMIGGKQKSTNDELMKSASAKSVKEKAGSTRSIVGFEYIEKTAGPQGGKSASENILGARPKSAKIKLGKSASARSANEMSGSTGSITGNGAIAKPPTKSKLEKAASAISITGKAASTGKILGKAISSKKIPNNGNDYIQNKDAKLGSSNSASSKKLASEAKVAADQASSMKSVKYGSDTLSRKPTGSLKEVGNLNQSENSVARNAVLSQNELLNGKSAAPSGAIYWSQKISSRNQSKILNSGTKSSSSSLRGFYSEKSLISENLGSKPAILQTEQTIPNPEALSVPCKADSESNSQEIYHTSAHLSNPDIDNYVVYPVEHLEEQVVIVKENENVMAESGLTEAAVHPDLHQSKISPEIEGGETQHSVVIIDQAGFILFI